MSVKEDIELIERALDRWKNVANSTSAVEAWDRLRKRLEYTEVTDVMLEHCKHDLDGWFATMIPDDDVHLRKFIENDIDFCLTLSTYYRDSTHGFGLDTDHRDNLTDLLAQQLLARHWPINMDDEEYKTQFYTDWKKKCEELGWIFNPSE